MKIFWEQLNQLIGLQQVGLHNTAIKLTLAGFEVEQIEYIKEVQDTLIDISITANRADIMGWAQVAAEISAIIGKPIENNCPLNKIRLVEIESIQEIYPLSAVYVCYARNTNTLNHNTYFTQRLKALGLNTTEGILDIVQFINLKWGQSIRVYDLAQYSNQENNLTIEYNQELSNEQDYLKVHIGHQELLEVNENNVHSLNKDSVVALVNCRHKQQADRSYCLHAYSEILNSIDGTAIANTADQLIYCYSRKTGSIKYIEVTPGQINQVLGPTCHADIRKKLDLQTITKITKSLNMPTEIKEGRAVIKIPAGRASDIKNKTDIAEEVGRIYGFDNFYDNLPIFRDVNRASLRCITRRQIRRTLRSMGLHEIISYSFHMKEAIGCNAYIINPLNQDQEALRINLIGSLVNIEKYNANQGNCNFEAFEVGKVFEVNKYNGDYKDSVRLSCIFQNNSFNQSSWQTEGTSLSWLQVKGQAEEIFERINAHVSWATSAPNNQLIESLKRYMHPRKSLYIMHADQAIGLMSQVKNSENTLVSRSYFMEIDLSKLIQTIKPRNHLGYTYNHYSAYPRISRDFSIVINATTSMQEIQEAIDNSIKNQEDSIIESVNVISEYYNDQHEKTICLRIIYRSKSKTLTSQEVKILDDILKSKLSSYSRVRHKPGSVLNYTR